MLLYKGKPSEKEIAEAKEAGIDPVLYKEWSDLMDALWKMAVKGYNSNKKETLYPKSQDNEIHLGRPNPTYIIRSVFVNNEYLDVQLFNIDNGKDKEILNLRHCMPINFTATVLYTALAGHINS